MDFSHDQQVNYEAKLRLLQQYFDVQFDINRLQVHYPTLKISQLQQNVRNQIKNILIDIQNQLFESRQIHCLKFSENYTTKVYKQFSNLQKILDEKSKNTFLSHYRNQIHQAIVFSAKVSLIQPLNNQTPLSVSLQDKLYLYQQFARHALKKNLFSAPNLPNSKSNAIIKKQQQEEDLIQIKAYQQQLLDTGYTEQIQSVYTIDQLHVIYNCYLKTKGRTNQLIYQIQGRGLKGYKFSTKALIFKLQNIKLIGLFQIYKDVFKQIDGAPLDWRQFKEIYGDIFVNWDQTTIDKLIKIAIQKKPEIKQKKQIALKLGKSYLQRYQGFNSKPKSSQFSSISFKPIPTPSSKDNRVLNTIKNEMRKLLSVGSNENKKSNF